MLKFTMTPLDVLFFGDARPFNKGSDAFSIFLPLPKTFASAVFAKLYHQKEIKYEKGKPIINNVYEPFIEKKRNYLFFSANGYYKSRRKFKSFKYS